jgi:hypothetical protein
MVTKTEPPVVEGLSAALQRFLRPVVRLLIARSIPFPFASNLLRGLYVDVAVNDFPLADKPQTDSRITLLTGVHRKDVRRLRGQRPMAPRRPRAAALVPQLIARWTTLPEYVDADGSPKLLPRLPRDDGAASFESLVRSVSKDIRPRVVLDEWLRLGIAAIDAEDRVHLQVAAFVPPQGSEEMTYYFGRNLYDHVAAAVRNMLADGEPLIERSVSYNNLSEDAVGELQALARERGMEVLQEINARALQLQRRDSGQPGATRRMSFGVYFLHEEQPAAAEDPADAE